MCEPCCLRVLQNGLRFGCRLLPAVVFLTVDIVGPCPFQPTPEDKSVSDVALCSLREQFVRNVAGIVVWRQVQGQAKGGEFPQQWPGLGLPVTIWSTFPTSSPPTLETGVRDRERLLVFLV